MMLAVGLRNRRKPEEKSGVATTINVLHLPEGTNKCQVALQSIRSFYGTYVCHQAPLSVAFRMYPYKCKYS